MKERWCILRALQSNSFYLNHKRFRLIPEDEDSSRSSSNHEEFLELVNAHYTDLEENNRKEEGTFSKVRGSSSTSPRPKERNG